MDTERANRYLAGAFLIIAGAVLSVASVTAPVFQTLFGSRGLLRAFMCAYSLGFLCGGILLFLRPRLGCTIPVVVLAIASVLLFVGLDEGLLYRALLAGWGLLCVGIGLVWRRKVPAR